MSEVGDWHRAQHRAQRGDPNQADLYREAALAATAHHIAAGRMTPEEAETSARASARHHPFRAAVDRVAELVRAESAAEIQRLTELNRLKYEHIRGANRSVDQALREIQRLNADQEQLLQALERYAALDAGHVLKTPGTEAPATEVRPT